MGLFIRLARVRGMSSEIEFLYSRIGTESVPISNERIYMVQIMYGAKGGTRTLMGFPARS